MDDIDHEIKRILKDDYGIKQPSPQVVGKVRRLLKLVGETVLKSAAHDALNYEVMGKRELCRRNGS